MGVLDKILRAGEGRKDVGGEGEGDERAALDAQHPVLHRLERRQRGDDASRDVQFHKTGSGGVENYADGIGAFAGGEDGVFRAADAADFDSGLCHAGNRREGNEKMKMGLPLCGALLPPPVLRGRAGEGVCRGINDLAKEHRRRELPP